MEDDDIAAALSALNKVEAALELENIKTEDISLNALIGLLQRPDNREPISGRGLALVRALDELDATQRQALVIGARLGSVRSRNPSWIRDLQDLIGELDPPKDPALESRAHA